MPSQRIVAAVVACGTAVASGCYSMQPVGDVAPKPGGELTVRLSDRGRATVAPTLGRDVSLVHGNLMRRDGDEYLVAMSSVEFSAGGARRLSGDSTRIATSDIAELFVNRFSKPRSIVAASVAAIALGVMAHEALKTTTKPSPPTDDLPGSGDKQRSGAGVSLFITPSTMNAIAHSSIVRWVLQPRR